MTEVFASQDIDKLALCTAYDRDGYFVLKGVFTSGEVEALRKETVSICQGERGNLIGS